MITNNLDSNSNTYVVRVDKYVDQLVTLEIGPTRYIPKKDDPSPIPLEAECYSRVLEERSVVIELTAPEANKNQDTTADIKVIIASLQDQSLDDIFNGIHDNYHTNSNNEAFYSNRLIKQQDISSDIAFIQLILDKIDNKALTTEQYHVLHKIIHKITKKNLESGANTEIYNEIYKLVSYLAKFKTFYAVTSVLKIAELIKDNRYFLVEIHADKILETLYNTIKDPIKTKLAQNDYALEFKNYIAQSIAKILQQLTTPENNNELINDWLKDDKLSKDFKETVTAELKNIGLFIESEHSLAEQLGMVNETVILDARETDTIEKDTEVTTQANSISYTSFNNYIDKDYPLKEFINYLDTLKVAELINELTIDFMDYLSYENQNSNFFTKLFANADSDLYIDLVKLIYKRTCKRKLDNNSYQILGSIVYSMHESVSKNNDIPIMLYDIIYQLIHQIAKNDVEIPIALLQKMIENPGKYKFQLRMSSYKQRVFGSYLKLLAEIFAKQQDAETYKLYNDMKGYITANTKSKICHPLGFNQYMATAIFNIGMELKDRKTRESFFEYWFKTDVGISKTFQIVFRRLF